jgi:transposase
MDAILSITSRTKNGSGRAAAAIAKRFGVSQATVYQARKVLKRGGAELVDALRRGLLPVKTAYKRLKTERETEQAR